MCHSLVNPDILVARRVNNYCFRWHIVTYYQDLQLKTPNNIGLAVIHDVQQLSLFSHLQFMGSFRHSGQIIVPHPTHVLSSLLQAQ